MTERSGMSRRQALMYGGLAAAAPLLPAARPAKKADPSGDSPLPQPVITSAQLPPTADGAGDVRIYRGGRRGAGHMRCQLQYPAIGDHIDLSGDSNQTGNVISED
jgi:hypothetical protein